MILKEYSASLKDVVKTNNTHYLNLIDIPPYD